MPLFTTENAATMGKAGAMKRWHSPKAEPGPQFTPQPSPPIPDTIASDAFAAKLMRAQEEKLDELLSAKDAKEVAALAQGLKALRETYHMVTGIPKPGNLRPSASKRPSSAWSDPAPAPLPPTTGSVLEHPLTPAPSTPPANPS